MPRKYGSSYRRRYKKKGNSTSMYPKSQYKRYSKRYKKTTQLSLYKPMQQIFPDILRTRVRNSVGVNWTGTAGAINAYVIGGNHLHLPLSSGTLSGAVILSTGTATAIYGLQNIFSADATYAAAGVYGKYRILGTTIRATTQVTTANAATLCIQPVDGNTIGNMGLINALTLTETRESPYAKSWAVSGNTTNNGVVSWHSMRTCTMFGLKHESSCEQGEFQGAQGVNPTNVWYWVLTWFPMGGTNTPATTTAIVEYDVEFFDRNALNSSGG